MKFKQWNPDKVKVYFINLWDDRPGTKIQHTAAAWDQRADQWEKRLRHDEAKIERTDHRIDAVIKYLLDQGHLQPHHNVVDIGCGPGRFVAEFAKRTEFCLGIDLSPKMIDYATAFAHEQNVTNAEFVAADFAAVDIDRVGWRQRFDLVFSYTTPALSRREDIRKSIAMSCGWCMHCGFVDSQDHLREDVCREVFGAATPRTGGGNHMYALFNLLWLEGYKPYVHYFSERHMDLVTVTADLARQICERIDCGDMPSSEAAKRVLHYLKGRADAAGHIEYPFDATYMWLLWDTTEVSNHSLS
ncbi:MAG TPA: class I SAM-dependent methyltransferase [Clostridiaceae bacterium]|nr:class I SAM-dependent methyltransferase [Clostridiaceae bacterium]